MTPWHDNGHLRLYVGDVRDVLPQLEDASVDCVITSPPYWGLRDYGTGLWAGGNPDCDHRKPFDNRSHETTGLNINSDPAKAQANIGHKHEGYRHVCGRCGATRQDQQLGLEPTPDEYVRNMVKVFREVWRVLAPHGTCWVNMGDTYNSRLDGSHGGWSGGSEKPQVVDYRGPTNHWQGQIRGLAQKNLLGMPWKVAFALQADGWILRSDIVWAKPNPMPESVTDRPTKAHEYVFLLTKKPRYWFDADAVREPSQDIPLNNRRIVHQGGVKFGLDRPGAIDESPLTRPRFPERYVNPAGRNVRSVWEIATQPYPEAHFATYPEELVRRCLLAGCPRWVCRTCGKPRERIVESEPDSRPARDGTNTKATIAAKHGTKRVLGNTNGWNMPSSTKTTLGWSDCGHSDYRPGRVLDPFLGSGTTALVARRHGRHAVGIELSEEYAALARERVKWWHRPPETPEPPPENQLTLLVS